jgi:glutamate/tyrosine decarboxylase-like PLP-dependent enzyme
MASLGLGRSHLRRIATLPDFTIDVSSLENQIAADRDAGCEPICVVGNAGTTNTGAIDPLTELARLCRQQRLWFHVDGAYGALAASTKLAGRQFKGLSDADSIVLNPHKWLFAPVEAACIVVRNRKALWNTFHMEADYLEEDSGTGEQGGFDYKDYNPQLTRSFRALKLWTIFKTHGAAQLRQAIEHNIEVMRYLAERIDQADDFVRLAPATLSVVCFQYRSADPAYRAHDVVNSFNAALASAIERDGRFFLSRTTLHHHTALRACSVNHRLRREHVDELLTIIREVAKRLE